MAAYVQVILIKQLFVITVINILPPLSSNVCFDKHVVFAVTMSSERKVFNFFSTSRFIVDQEGTETKEN